MLATGAKSGVMALEIDPRCIRNARVYLAHDDDSWHRSLRFAYQGMCLVLPAHAPGMRTVGERYLVLRLHAGDPIFLSPSITPDGIRTDYFDSSATVLPAPEWLVSAMHGWPASAPSPFNLPNFHITVVTSNICGLRQYPTFLAVGSRHPAGPAAGTGSRRPLACACSQ
jgi:hypothetical protein